MKYKRGKNPKSRNGFKKGYNPSEETRKKLRLIAKSKGTIPPSRLGIKTTKETKSKISLALKGKKAYKMTDEIKNKMSEGHKGKIPWNEKKKTPIDVRRKQSEARIGRFAGKDHWNWKDGITPFRIKFWHSKEYQEWRNKVFQRDNFTCQICGTRGGKLEAHHLLRFVDYPKLRLEISNGITLCKKCHRKLHRTKKVKKIIKKQNYDTKKSNK